jgi:glycosyltransferase involved in cell wall biosynthesis
MADSRHVAFYVPALRVGGAQRVTITLANGLAERGHDVDLVLSYREGELLSQVDDAVSVVDLRTPKVPVLGILASVPRMRSYLETVEPSVLFAAITYANVTSLLAAAVADTDTRVVPTEHNRFEMESGLKSAVTSVLARRLYRLADGIVAVSAGVATSVADGTGVARDDVTVLYNPVPIADVRSRAREPIDEHLTDDWLRSPAFETIVSVGRLETPKDPETLLRAFERVNSVRPDTRLILVGDGSKREELFDLAERLDIDEAVSLPGYAANPYAYMGWASVFVLSSEFEGLPTVLIEALACGCPVVATDCPSGPREILADGEYGTLVPVGDATALEDAIRSTLKTPTDPEKLTRRARDFSVETIVDQYEGFIEQLIDRRANGRAR